MNRAIIHLIVLTVLLSCTEEPIAERDSSTAWGIDFSPEDEAYNAFGYMSRQNTDSNEALLIEAAHVRAVKNDRYKITYKFTSADSLRIIIAKRTEDFNFGYPQADTLNQLLLVIFNTDTLPLSRSSISVQPLTENDKFHTVTNVYTRGEGKFNGTIDGVPLLE